MAESGMSERQGHHTEIDLDREILDGLVTTEPEAFSVVVEKAKNALKVSKT